jgi:hypothetical protein
VKGIRACRGLAVKHQVTPRAAVPRLAFGGLVAAAICGLAGCVGAGPAGGPAPTASGPGGGLSETATGGARVDGARLRQQIDSPIKLPYTPYCEMAREVVAASYERRQDAWRRWHDESEGFVAGCMKEAGFDYFPVEYDPTAPKEVAREAYPQGDVLDIPGLPGTLAETQRVGYGVVSAGEYSGGDEFSEPASDRNSEYFESLSASARRQYHLALYGVDPDSDQVLNPDNCGDKAIALYPMPASDGAPSLDTLDIMQRVMGGGQYTVDITTGDWTVDKEAEVWELWGSPAYKELSAEYTDCVRRADASGAVALWLGGEEVTIGPAGMLALAVATAADGSVADAWGASQLPEEQASLVGSQAERDVAVLDFKCREETDYANRYAEAVYRVQADYIAAHRAEVEKLEAAMMEYLARG